MARQLLLAGHDPIGQIAADVGYQSEAALSRAFLRRFGVRPGRLRQDAAMTITRPSGGVLRRQAKERASFCEQKEAKKLC